MNSAILADKAKNLERVYSYQTFHVTASNISPVFMASELTLALAVIYSSRLSDKLGMVKTIVYTYVLAILMLFVLPFTLTFFEASVVYVLKNALMNMASPVFNALIMSLIPRDERSRANSLIQLQQLWES